MFSIDFGERSDGSRPKEYMGGEDMEMKGVDYFLEAWLKTRKSIQ